MKSHSEGKDIIQTSLCIAGNVSGEVLSQGQQTPIIGVTSFDLCGHYWEVLGENSAESCTESTFYIAGIQQNEIMPSKGREGQYLLLGLDQGLGNFL